MKEITARAAVAAREIASLPGAGWSTSVGAAAIRRFLRPVALQGVPPEPAALVGPQ